MCGSTVTSGRAQNGDDAGSGSWSKTSNTACDGLVRFSGFLVPGAGIAPGRARDQHLSGFPQLRPGAKHAFYLLDVTSPTRLLSREDQSPWLPYTATILPGFMMLSGSIARLIVRINSTAGRPCSLSRYFIFFCPTPC